MPFHSLEHGVKCLQGVDDVRALVEHHAFGPDGLRSVADLGPSRGAGLREPIENLGGPDDRGVGSFADGQDLFLDLRESVEPEFDGEVTAGDHHAEAFPLHGGEQQFWQVSEGRSRFDIQHDTDLRCVEIVECGVEGVDVVGCLDERVVDQVGVLGHEAKRVSISLGEGGQLEFGVRQVDALVAPQLAAISRCFGDQHGHLVVCHLLHHPGELAIIEAHRISDLDLLQDRAERASHTDRAFVV